MMMYSLHSTPAPLSLPSSADNGRTTDIKMIIMWTVLTAVWTEISPNNNTTQYLQILPSTQ